MKTLQILFLILISWSLAAEKTLVTGYELTRFQPDNQITLMESEVEFWQNKLQSDAGNAAYLQRLAAAHSALFDLTGKIGQLKKAETYISQSIKNNKIHPEGALRTMAQLLIKQHRFCEALDYALEAKISGADLRMSQLVLYDIYMELGDKPEAFQYLKKVAATSDFDYLIRRAKWEDSNGNLEGAINYLERALHLAEDSNNQEKMSWIYTNIADFYGHDGQIEKSYAFYNKALQLNPADWYAVKKLAWIAWSYDRNDDTALKLLQDISLFNSSPGITLLKSDILEYQNKTDLASKIREAIMEQVSKPAYGRMYAAFLNDYWLERGDIQKAQIIAEEEVNERPSYESYVMLMNTHYAKGNQAFAKTIAREHIIGITEEPLAMLDVMHVLADSDPEKNKIISELEACDFELGPLQYAKIKKTIS